MCDNCDRLEKENEMLREITIKNAEFEQHILNQYTNVVAIYRNLVEDLKKDAIS